MKRVDQLARAVALLVAGSVALHELSGCSARDSESGNPIVVQIDEQGMHCEGCVEAIDAEVRTVDGVSDAKVSLVGHCAQLTVSNREASLRAEAAIRSLGYTVTVVPLPSDPASVAPPVGRPSN